MAKSRDLMTGRKAAYDLSGDAYELEAMQNN